MAASTLRILILGDVVAKPGRAAVRRWLPEIRKKKKVDFVIANVENLAHGKGITRKTLKELLDAGVDCCTSGNHILSKEGAELLNDSSLPVIRPANFPDGTPGKGDGIFDVGKTRVLVINLIGTTFFRDGATYANPFLTADAILAKHEHETLHAIIVDWHAEATSEKIALGWHLDGRVSVIVGTHTHVPTADLRILPAGTAFRSDTGMTGLRDEVLGSERGVILHNFLHPNDTHAQQWTDSGPVQFHAVLVDVDRSTRRALRVETIDHESDG